MLTYSSLTNNFLKTGDSSSLSSMGTIFSYIGNKKRNSFPQINVRKETLTEEVSYDDQEQPPLKPTRKKHAGQKKRETTTQQKTQEDTQQKTQEETQEETQQKTQEESQQKTQEETKEPGWEVVPDNSTSTPQTNTIYSQKTEKIQDEQKTILQTGGIMCGCREWYLWCDWGREGPASLLPQGDSRIKRDNINLEEGGDYVISCTGRLRALIERKTLNDLTQSLKDGRWHFNMKRLLKLKQEESCDVYCLIEHKSAITNKKMLEKLMDMRSKGVIILYTTSKEHSAWRLMKLLDEYQLNHTQHLDAHLATSDQRAPLKCPDTERLNDLLHKKSTAPPKNKTGRSEADTKARMLYHLTKQRTFTAVAVRRLQKYSIRDLLSNLKLVDELSLPEKLHECFYDMSHHIDKKRGSCEIRDMLAEVPGIAKYLPTIILENFTLQQLWEGAVRTDTTPLEITNKKLDIIKHYLNLV